MMDSDLQHIVRSLRTCRGQVDGIIGMVEAGREPSEISNQILAAQALLTRVHKNILGDYIDDCVIKALSNPEEAENRLKGIPPVLEKLMSL